MQMVMAVHLWVGVKESGLLGRIFQELESETNGYWVPRRMPALKDTHSNCSVVCGGNITGLCLPTMAFHASGVKRTILSLLIFLPHPRELGLQACTTRPV